MSTRWKSLLLRLRVITVLMQVAMWP